MYKYSERVSQKLIMFSNIKLEVVKNQHDFSAN